jgi:hypothetical protein
VFQVNCLGEDGKDEQHIFTSQGKASVTAGLGGASAEIPKISGESTGSSLLRAQLRHGLCVAGHAFSDRVGEPESVPSLGPSYERHVTDRDLIRACDDINLTLVRAGEV